MAARRMQDHVARVAAQGQQAATGAVRAWAEALRLLAGAVPDATAVVDGTTAVVGGAFDVAEAVLRAQREVAMGALRLVRPRPRPRDTYPRCSQTLRAGREDSPPPRC